MLPTWPDANSVFVRSVRDVLLLDRAVGETDRMNPCCDMGCFDCYSLKAERVRQGPHQAFSSALLEQA